MSLLYLDSAVLLAMLNILHCAMHSTVEWLDFWYRNEYRFLWSGHVRLGQTIFFLLVFSAREVQFSFASYTYVFKWSKNSFKTTLKKNIIIIFVFKAHQSDETAVLNLASIPTVPKGGRVLCLPRKISRTYTLPYPGT